MNKEFHKIWTLLTKYKFTNFDVLKVRFQRIKRPELCELLTEAIAKGYVRGEIREDGVEHVQEVTVENCKDILFFPGNEPFYQKKANIVKLDPKWSVAANKLSNMLIEMLKADNKKWEDVIETYNIDRVTIHRVLKKQSAFSLPKVLEIMSILKSENFDIFSLTIDDVEQYVDNCN